MATLKRSALAGVIAGLLESTKQPEQLAKEVAAYLVSQRQTKDLDAILRDVMTARAQNGIIETEVTTAFPLSSEVKTQVQALLKAEYPTAKQFVVQESVKPQVLSGIRIQTPDKQLDETARGKLDHLIKAVA